MDFLTQNEMILPLIFAGLMGLSMLIYAVLDGYDLGVGMLSALVQDDEKDTMIASIGPFWDANETWLVLGVGLLLVAFPLATSCPLFLTTASLLSDSPLKTMLPPSLAREVPVIIPSLLTAVTVTLSDNFARNSTWCAVRSPALTIASFKPATLS